MSDLHAARSKRCATSCEPALRGTSVQDQPVNLNRRQFNALMLASLAAPVSAFSSSSQSHPRYRIVDFDWLDRARSRPVPARLYWPSEETSKNVPLVVFSHGIGGSREGYSYLGTHWSSRGVASLHVQHVGSDAALWRGNPFELVGRLQAAAREQEAIARAADVRFALDQILLAPGGWGEAIDRECIVAAGHSYGANTTLLSIGAQVIRNGQMINCRDSRFSAAVVISAPPFYGERDLQSVLSNVSVPTIHVTSTEDVIEIPGYRSEASDRVAIFDAISHPIKLLAVFHGGSHSMFTDRALTGGLMLNPKVKLATAQLALAFIDLVFAKRNAALARWSTEWECLLARAPSLTSGVDR